VTTQGQAISNLFLVFTAAGIVVALIVWSLATWAIVRYRSRPGDALPRQTRGDIRVEAIWTILPLATVVILFILTVGSLNIIDASDPAAVKVHVTAFRWGWRADYPGSGRTEIGVRPDPAVLVMPVGVPIEIKLDSADVDHSFYIPAFLFKRDAIPGRPSTFEITIQTAGSYPGECAEYCGIGHAEMPFVIDAVPATSFEAWLAGGPAPVGLPGVTP
jgi:cytochrome c oxidase subunit 2